MSRRHPQCRVPVVTKSPAAHLDRFRPLSAAVIRFGGEEPTPERVDALAAWYANGSRSRSNQGA
jgi:hypothetical protein